MMVHTTVSHLLIGLFFFLIITDGNTHQIKSPIATFITIPIITNTKRGLEKPPLTQLITYHILHSNTHSLWFEYSHTNHLKPLPSLFRFHIHQE